MKDVDKDTQELIKELEELRQQVAQLQASEADYKKAEERYRLLITNATEGITVAQDGKIKFANPKFIESTGYTLEELTSIEPTQIVHPDDRDTVTDYYAQRLRGEFVPESYTFRIIDKNGNIKWLDRSVTSISWEGRPAVLVFSTDVTERKRMEQAVRDSEAKYKDLAESITDVFFAMDENLRYTYWNKASEELTGISATDALGKHLCDIFPDTEATGRAENTYLRALNTKKPQHLVTAFPVGGRDFVFEINAYPAAAGLCVYVRDITERTKLEEALRESEQWYRLIFDNTAIGIGFASVDGRVITLNKAMESISGYSVEDFNKINLEDIYVDKADRDNFLHQLRKTGSVIDYPVRLKRKDGTEFDAILTSKLTAIGDREFLQTICHDVTERKRAEEALRESEERYRSLVELSPDAIFVASEGKHVFINSAGMKLFGASSPDQIIGRTVIEFIHQDYRETVATRMRQALETGIAPPTIEEKFLRLDGTEIDVEVRATPLIYQGGPAMQAVIRDISERKQAEAELRTKDNAIASSISGILLLDLDGVILYANQAYLDLWAYGSAKEAIGHNITEIAADKELARQLLTIVRTEGEWKGELHATARDDRTIDVLLSESLVRDERGIPVAIMASTIDITERKQAERQLQQEKERAQQYLDIAGVMLIANDADGRVSLINRKGCEVLGYQQQEVIGKNWFDILIPERARAEGTVVFKKLMTGEVEPVSYYENPILTKNGEERIIAWHNVILKDGTGKIVGTLSSGEDITERKKAEDRVSIQHELSMKLSATDILDEALRLCLEAALNISGLDCGGVYLVDGSGGLDLVYHRRLSVEFVNSSSHYQADSVNVRLVMAGVPIYSRHTELGAPLDIVKQREGLRAIAVVPVFYENHIIGCLNVASHTLDDVPVSSRNALEIITAQIGSLIGRIKSRQELEKSEERYRLLAENVRDVIWSTDMDLRFTYVSPSIKYLGDRTAEKVMSMSLEQLLSPTSQELAMKAFAEELAMVKTTPPDSPRSRTLEVEFLRRDGSVLWAELKMNFMRDAAGQPVGILGVMRDISERKIAEEERREFEQKAQLASRLASVGELAAGVAHEINNPLTGVIGYAELLMQEDVPERIKKDLEVIHSGAKRVADVVKGLLKFARQAKPERTLVNINEIIEVTLRLRAYELETSNIKVTTKLDPDLPLTIADPGQLQQVFLNLLINSETEMRSAHGKGKLVVKTEAIDSKIRISFKDDGPGITKANLERIFEPFFTTREVGKGTGLGLSICHGIVTDHGGRISVESRLGAGATFIVELPVIAKKRSRRVKPVHTRQKKATGKILVVDDEPVVRQLLTEVLAAEGHEVDATADGADALKKIRNNGYNLVLLDIKLPGLSGSELYGRIRKISLTLAKRVVFITGDVMAADTEDFLATTRAPFIAKPFNVKQLKSEVSRLLTSVRTKRSPKLKIKNRKPKTKI